MAKHAIMDQLEAGQAILEGGDQNTSFDPEKLEKLRQEYLMSLTNKSDNRHEALDLFLMIDVENDQFLKFEEVLTIWPMIKSLSDGDRGKIQSEEDLRENFEFFEHHQIDRQTFNKFVDRCEFNVAKVRD